LPRLPDTIALWRIFAMKAVLLSTLLAAVGAVELTKANWDELTSGKSVFIKFQAPW
jgi:hypothetical protein